MLSRLTKVPKLTQLAAGRLAGRAISARFNSSTPEERATSILQQLPGKSLFEKSSGLMIAASVATYLISKEIYLIDGEAFEVLCIFGAYYVWYQGAKDMAKDYFKERQQTISSVLDKARLDHKQVVEERIDHISKLNDVVNTTEALYDISKDMVKLEAEAFELKQKVAFTQEVKTVLDAWVRQEAAAREQEQQNLASTVMTRVQEKLKDSKTQSLILNQSIQELEKLRLH